MRESVDTDGVVSPFDQFVERPVPILIAGAGPASFDPRKIPHGDGPGTIGARSDHVSL
jgi:hypothetical protein